MMTPTILMVSTKMSPLENVSHPAEEVVEGAVGSELTAIG